MVPWAGRALEAMVVPLPAPNGRAALVLARLRTAAPEADLVFAAPAPDRGNGGSLTWGRVIAEACQWLGGRGVQRVYVAVAEDDRVALQVLQHTGFAVYTTDVVVRRSAAGGTASGRPGAAPPGALSATEDHAVRQLAVAAVPEAVRAHLPLPGADWDTYPVGGSPCAAVAAGAWLDPHGRVVGGWRAVAGAHGAWLRLAHGQGAPVGDLVKRALAAVSADERFGRRSLFSSARGYEPELHAALHDAGFETVARRYLLARHTAIRVLSPAWTPPGHREAALEAKPTSARLAQAHPMRETSCERNTGG